jgi:hypothetical protein
LAKFVMAGAMLALTGELSPSLQSWTLSSSIKAAGCVRVFLLKKQLVF